MKNRILILGLIFSIQSHASDLEKNPLSPIIYESLIRPLMTEITPITGIPLPKEEPKIYITSRQEIEKQYCKDETKDCHVAAITDDETGEIYLSPALIQLNIFTASVVFHELVHWAQIKNNLFRDEEDCRHWAKSEMHAYTAQSDFLKKHGARGFRVPNFLAQCN